MERQKSFYQVVEEICAQDSRYKPDAYEFVVGALHFTQTRLKKSAHVSGKELLEGIRDFAIEQYGPMAQAVFSHWGIKNTEDFGHIVFDLIGAKMFSKTEDDSLEDFKGVYDFDAAFRNVLRDSLIRE